MDKNIYTSDYMRKLLIEAPRIRAKLENPGGSVILTNAAASTEQQSDYSTQIGSGFHLDLVETESYLADEPIEQQRTLILWVLGLSAQQAAMYHSAKGTVESKRRDRAVKTLTKKMNNGDRTTKVTRRTSQRSFEKARRPTRRFT